MILKKLKLFLKAIMEQGGTVCTVAVTLTVKLMQVLRLVLSVLLLELGLYLVIRRSAGVLGTGTGLMGDGSTNINVVGVGAGNGTAPTAFQA